MSLSNLFLIVLFIKIGCAIAAWQTGLLWELGFWAPLGVMVLYLLYGHFKTRKGSWQDRMNYGDSAYYLGFLFTVASIILTLFTLGARFNAQEVAIRFGAAMITTLLGMAVRVYLVTFAQRKRSTLIGPGRAARHYEEYGMSRTMPFQHRVRNDSLDTTNRSYSLTTGDISLQVPDLAKALGVNGVIDRTVRAGAEGVTRGLGKLAENAQENEEKPKGREWVQRKIKQKKAAAKQAEALRNQGKADPITKKILTREEIGASTKNNQDQKPYEKDQEIIDVPARPNGIKRTLVARPDNRSSASNTVASTSTIDAGVDTESTQDGNSRFEVSVDDVACEEKRKVSLSERASSVDGSETQNVNSLSEGASSTADGEIAKTHASLNKEGRVTQEQTTSSSSTSDTSQNLSESIRQGITKNQLDGADTRDQEFAGEARSDSAFEASRVQGTKTSRQAESSGLRKAFNKIMGRNEPESQEIPEEFRGNWSPKGHRIQLIREPMEVYEGDDLNIVVEASAHNLLILNRLLIDTISNFEDIRANMNHLCARVGHELEDNSRQVIDTNVLMMNETKKSLKTMCDEFAQSLNGSVGILAQSVRQMTKANEAQMNRLTEQNMQRVQKLAAAIRRQLLMGVTGLSDQMQSSASQIQGVTQQLTSDLQSVPVAQTLQDVSEKLSASACSFQNKVRMIELPEVYMKSTVRQFNQHMKAEVEKLDLILKQVEGTASSLQQAMEQANKALPQRRSFFDFFRKGRH